MTMEKFKPGQRAEMEVEVTKDLTTNRMGREGADVLSTPELLGLMENVCIKATEPNLPEGHTTVGYAVDGLRHLVATALGGTIVVKTELTEVDRNRLTFSIEAYEGDTRVALAMHKRAVISTDPDA
jgi:fluoroacetyl-CoA thioesterase